MKTNIVSGILAVLVSVVTVNAATVSVSGGFGIGVIVSTNTVNTAYSLEVGNYSGSIFTAFNAPIVDNASGIKISGTFGGDGPSSLNNLPIFLRVSVDDGFGDNGFVILSTAAVFTADVSDPLGSVIVSFTSSASGSIIAFGGANVSDVTYGSVNNLNFTAIPEPSVALLGAFGILALLRRRR